MKKEHFEFNLYECLTHGAFRVRARSGHARDVEECPECGTPCVRAMPLALDIELTNACPCRCIMCPRGDPDYSRPVGYMSDKVFSQLTKEISHWNVQQPNTIRWVWMHLGGESLLHPKFVQWVNALAKAGVGSIAVSTNAVPLTQPLIEAILGSELHRLIISLDGVSKAVYESIRVGAKFEKVQANVDMLLKLARQRVARQQKVPQIWIQILRLKDNEEEWLPFVRKYAESSRIRSLTKYRPIPGLPGGRVFCKNVERFGGQIDAEKHPGWDHADKRRFSCRKPWQRASVWWDGRVTICCYAIDQGPVMGSLETNSLHGIWLAKPFQDLRHDLSLYQSTDGDEGVLPALCRRC